ncbi:hypothetical protein HK098_001173 [Nowakowskiella sp. JEL0407]|nr:hypothetical protein HK098_001173 [Nowakowskiella sp. JEL0407]
MKTLKKFYTENDPLSRFREAVNRRFPSDAYRFIRRVKHRNVRGITPHDLNYILKSCQVYLPLSSGSKFYLKLLRNILSAFGKFKLKPTELTFLIGIGGCANVGDYNLMKHILGLAESHQVPISRAFILDKLVLGSIFREEYNEAMELATECEKEFPGTSELSIAILQRWRELQNNAKFLEYLKCIQKRVYEERLQVTADTFSAALNYYYLGKQYDYVITLYHELHNAHFRMTTDVDNLILKSYINARNISAAALHQRNQRSKFNIDSVTIAWRIAIEVTPTLTYTLQLLTFTATYQLTASSVYSNITAALYRVFNINSPKELLQKLEDSLDDESFGVNKLPIYVVVLKSYAYHGDKAGFEELVCKLWSLRGYLNEDVIEGIVISPFARSALYTDEKTDDLARESSYQALWLLDQFQSKLLIFDSTRTLPYNNRSATSMNRKGFNPYSQHQVTRRNMAMCRICSKLYKKLVEVGCEDAVLRAEQLFGKLGFDLSIIKKGNIRSLLSYK